MTHYISTLEAAKLLNLSERGIRNRIERGYFISAKRCECHKKNWLIEEEEIKSLLLPKITNENKD